MPAPGTICAQAGAGVLCGGDTGFPYLYGHHLRRLEWPAVNFRNAQEQALRAQDRWQTLEQKLAAATAENLASQHRAQLAVHEAQEKLKAEVAKHAETQLRLAKQAEELAGISTIGSQELQDARDAVKVESRIVIGWVMCARL
jgi:hypothetical protein